MEATVDKVLEEAAAAVAAAGGQRKERTPKADRVPRTPKEPKEKLYVQWNEDGTPKLDADGNRVKGPVKMAKPKVAREGGGSRTVLPDDAVLKLTDKANTFREGTKRHQNFAVIKDGMTVGEYFTAAGPRGETATFLIWYIKEGFVTATKGDSTE